VEDVTSEQFDDVLNTNVRDEGKGKKEGTKGRGEERGEEGHIM
jgi:hypothetical protein